MEFFINHMPSDIYWCIHANMYQIIVTIFKYISYFKVVIEIGDFFGFIYIKKS